MGGSGYWRAQAGDDEPGAEPTREPGEELDSSPDGADRPTEAASAKGWTYKPTGHWLNLDRLSTEALASAQGHARPDRTPGSPSGRANATDRSDIAAEAELESPAQGESGGPVDPLADFDPRLHRPGLTANAQEQANRERHEPVHADQQPQRDRLPDDGVGAIERFEPRRANLPDVSREGAVGYVRDNADQRPWLKPAERSPAEVQHVVAAVDQGGGHFLERHEGYATDERLERRVGGLEDPAQLDSGLRTRGKDSEKPQRLHGCEDLATSINQPEAFAAAFASGIQHPDVKTVLDRPRQPHERPPFDVEVPIVDVLGENGHQYCVGYRLLPIDGDIDAANETGSSG
ncbi:hypothetical protein [Flindersiella endophytica]